MPIFLLLLTWTWDENLRTIWLFTHLISIVHGVPLRSRSSSLQAIHDGLSSSAGKWMSAGRVEMSHGHRWNRRGEKKLPFNFPFSLVICFNGKCIHAQNKCNNSSWWRRWRDRHREQERWRQWWGGRVGTSPEIECTSVEAKSSPFNYIF